MGHGAPGHAMTLAELAVTVAALGLLGLLASRFGLSAIPAYLLAGLLLGPNEPKVLSLIQPSEVTEFVAQLGIVFLLFFLGLEFTLGRLARSRRHALVGGSIDFVLNAGLGLAVGVAAFGLHFGALILAGAIYVSSSAITVKGLIDFRRLADDETDLVLAILVAEDLVIGLILGFAGGGGGALGSTLVLVAKALGFITLSLAASKWLSRPFDRLLQRLPREFFLLAAFAFLVGMAAVAEELGLSEAIGALMAGVVLSETSVREELEERFFSFRDVFAALFFFVFGLSIDLGAIDEVGWLVAAAVARHARRQDRRRLLLGSHGRLHEATEPERGGGARGARRVHDHPRPDRLDEPAALTRDPDQAGCVLRPLRPCHGDRRRGADEGVEEDRSPPVPGA